MQRGTWVNALCNGDISFTNFDFDVQTLARKFGVCIHGLNTVLDFELNVDESFSKAESGSYWRTVLVKEAIQDGQVGHFCIKYINGAMLGAMEGTRACTFDQYLGRNGNERGYAIYLGANSLYSSTQADKGEFRFVRAGQGDDVGVLIDMREPNNGRMFFTHKDKVMGQMFKGLKAPIYPAISHSSNGRKAIEENYESRYHCKLPLGWNDPKFRDDSYITRMSSVVVEECETDPWAV
jgi:hypothetical protein